MITPAEAARIAFRMIVRRYAPADDAPPPPWTEGEAHLWCGRTDVDGDDLARLRAMLSADERDRAAKIVLPAVRRRFTAARGILREILGRYAGLRPSEIAFAYGPHGKPAIVDGVRFSLSHTEEVVAVAVHRDREVGVDVERLRAVGNHRDVAKRFFAPAEHAVLAALSGEAADRAFLRCWTRKEACSKVYGEALIPMLKRLEVTVDPAAAARLVAIDGNPAAADGWILEDFEPESGYVGALAIGRER